MLQKIIDFFKPESWKVGESASFFKRFLFKYIRISLSSIQGFIDDKGFDKASTLTFYSLLAIIPLLAISFGVAQSFGLDENFKKQVEQQFEQQPEVAEKLVEFSNSTLKTTKGGQIASFGLVLLFWTVLKTIGNIAAFFNEIWKVPPRSFCGQIKSFTPIILLFPLFIVAASSIILYSSTTAITASESIPLFNYLTPLVTIVFHLISAFVGWSLFIFLFMYLPNTSVTWKAGIIGGIVAGILFFIWQWIYVTFQLKASSYGAIYGSFAAVPLFLIWLNYSWLIILFGAEISYHTQQEETK
ncbi:MAG: YihY/virulence factor BrkB family protein [Parachlamydia sp.]|nr:YihY/virulence factor BrkB family protein [Parachlamydia sp.]